MHGFLLKLRPNIIVKFINIINVYNIDKPTEAMQMARLEKVELKAVFREDEEIYAGDLAVAEAEKIAKEIARRATVGWAKKGITRMADADVTYDSLRHKFWVHVAVTKTETHPLSTPELWNEFAKTEQKVTDALLKEILSTLKLAKRMALIRQVLGWKDDGALVEAALEKEGGMANERYSSP